MAAKQDSGEGAPLGSCLQVSGLLARPRADRHLLPGPNQSHASSQSGPPSWLTESSKETPRAPQPPCQCGCRAPPCALESAQLQIDKRFVTALGRRLCGWRSRQSPRHNCQPATNRCVSRWQVWIGHRNPRCGSLLSQRSTQIVLQRRNACSAGVAPAGAKRRATALSLLRRPVTAVGALLDSCSPTPLSH